MPVNPDAVVVGSGPNGLAAAIRLAQHRLQVLVLEANDSLGGGCRSGELTLPGFVHDLCSAVHPLALASPFFRQLPLGQYGLEWLQPQVPLAHPLEQERVALLHRSVPETAALLGLDQKAYETLLGPLVRHWEDLVAEFLQPLWHWPRHPLTLGRFGVHGLRSAAALVKSRFCGEAARALFGGMAAHSFLALEQPASAAYGLVLGLAGHAVGWPLPRGGAQSLTNALAAHLRSLGGEIVTGVRIGSFDQLPKARAVLLDLTPRQALKVLGAKLPVSYRQRLERFRYGPGVFKLDYALSRPVPWKAPACLQAGTVHLGATFEEVATAERAVAQGRIAERPFVLFVQPTLLDPSRAPAGRHTAWAYCHVPNGSTADMTEPMERQIERFAPGFRDTILARHAMNCAHLEAHNANLVGGDINGGAGDLWQLLARPVFSLHPYRLPVRGCYLCSASTPPGGGVHGMCGFLAAEAALRDCFE